MARQVSVTLRGKSYLISTNATEVHLHEAAAVLDKTMAELSEAGVRREDQLALFSALMGMVEVIKERDSVSTSLQQHADRLSSALES